MSQSSPRSLRRAYLEWVEEQVEEFKDSIPRSQLLAIADQVVNELRMANGGQYQLTELLLCDTIDRHLIRMLKLPGYRAWCAQRREQLSARRPPAVIPFREIAPAPVQVVRVPAPPAAAYADRAEEPVACVG